MRLLRVVLGPEVWAMRTAWSVVILILIWRHAIMEVEDMILSLPAEFFPLALALCAVIGIVITLVRSLSSFYEKDKELARAGQTPLTYGMAYIGENVAVIIVAAIAGPVLTGCYYQAAGADPTLWGVIGIAATVAAVVALGGDKFLKGLLEALRDRSKAKEARETTKNE